MDAQNIQFYGITGNEFTVREGKAPDVYIPKSLMLTGNIDTPLRYIEKQKASFPVFGGVINANIEVDREEMTIKLYVDPKGQSFDSIWGKLAFAEEFTKFGINSGEEQTPNALGEFIKMNRSCLTDRDTAMNLVKVLRSFNAKIAKALEVVKDDRANYNLHKSQAVESNLPETFFLDIPIFKGQPKKKIEVEININADTLACSLISPEANDYISEQKNLIIDEQIKKIQEIMPELCIIEV
jgi:hypothetical protein